ncbi:hypothetical protein ACHAXS_013447 [Conticribra weissflogii]
MTPNPRIILLTIATHGALSHQWKPPSSSCHSIQSQRGHSPSFSRHQSAFVSSLPRAITRELKYPHADTPSSTSSQETLLNAASSSRKKKKSKSSSSNSSGFGKISPAKPAPKNSNDGAITYPELEPSVRDTLIPSHTDFENEENGSSLAEEIYDRLEDIYGLEKFNFGGVGAIYKSIAVVGSSNPAKDGDGSSDIVYPESDSLFNDILTGIPSKGSENNSPANSLDDLLSPASLISSTTQLTDSTSTLFPNLESSPSSLASTSGSESNEESSFDLNSLPPFQKFRVLHTDPMVLAIDDFFTPEECDRYVQISLDSEEQQKTASSTSQKDPMLKPLLLGQSQTVGKDSRSKAQRTSTTWFHYYEGVPELMAKASRLLGLEGIERWEEPQTVRQVRNYFSVSLFLFYRRNEKFTWHLDALSPEEATNPSGAGQRVATLLVYLTELSKENGGSTMFRDLVGGDGSAPLKMRPKKGSALLFFPAAGGIPSAPFDIRTLHCGEVVAEDSEEEKWIAQLWLRQRNYRPTAPVGNVHWDAISAIGRYCDSGASLV